MLVDYDNCLHKIACSSASLSKITIGIPPYIRSLATHRISMLSESYPQVLLELVEDSSKNLLQYFLDGKLDILNTSIPVDDPSLYKTVLGSYRVYILLRNGSRAAEHSHDCGGPYPELDPKYLSGEPFAFSSEGSRTRLMATDILMQANVKPLIYQTVRRPTTLCLLAEQGIATSIYPLTQEISRSITDRTQIFQIPDSYKSTETEQLLLCRKRDLERFPPGFYQLLEQIFRQSILESNSP